MLAGRAAVSRALRGWNTLQMLDHTTRGFSTVGYDKKEFFNKRSEKSLFKSNFLKRRFSNKPLGSLEISHAHSVLQNSEAYSNTVANSLVIKDDFEDDQVQQLIDKQWISMSTKELLNNFETLSCYACKYNVMLSESKYQGIVEVLTNKVKNFSNKDILRLLNCMDMWLINREDKPMHQQIFNLLKAIDVECMNRLTTWNINEVFLIHDLLFKLRFLKLSYFTPRILTSLKLQDLTSSHLVQLAFLMKVHGKIKVSFQDIEFYVKKYFDKFTVEELGIISMAFFKYQVKINDRDLVIKIIQALQKNINDMSDVTLSSILKSLRYSVHLDIIQIFTSILQLLVKQVSFRSLQCVTHIAHLQSSALIHNKELIFKILDRYEKEMDQARLKDIERIAFTLYVFNYNPQDVSFFSTAIKEIMHPKRINEIEKFPKSLVYTVMYMLQLNFYHEESLKYVMNPAFIDKLSRESIQNLNREYLILDYCIELEHPNYNGPRLDKTTLNYLKKYGALYKPPPKNNRKIDHNSKLITDVVYTCTNLLGSKSFVHVDSLLPHVTQTHIVLCYDPEKKKFISSGEQISQIPLGSIKYAPQNGKKWFVVVLGSHNTMTRDDNSPIGILALQIRHLKCIGYTPILINYNDWRSMFNSQIKEKFISNILKSHCSL